MDVSQKSDKGYWHGYLEFYERHFPQAINGLIVEFGVQNGYSIRSLAERFPDAKIIGVDIVEQKSLWPVQDNISYHQLDQGSESDIVSFFKNVGTPTLIIDDGSHLPSHQSRCLKHGFASLKNGGIYVLEDIHSNLPDHYLYKEENPDKNKSRGLFGRKPRTLLRKRGSGLDALQTSLTILLAFDHLKRMGHHEAPHSQLLKLTDDGYFSVDALGTLYNSIEEIHFYRRATLPSACRSCGSTNFQYNTYACECGMNLYYLCDSISVILRKKVAA